MNDDQRHDRLIQQAKGYQNPDRRRWLETQVPVPYNEEQGDETYPCRFFVLEGTPLRGFLLAHAGVVIRLDPWGRRLKLFHIDDDEQNAQGGR